MNLAIGLAAITVLATTAGGVLAIKSRDRLHLVLGLSAGLLLGLVAFDLLPVAETPNLIAQPARGTDRQDAGTADVGQG